MLELRASLEDLGLQEHFNSLVEYGFDTWDNLVGISETDMALIGIKLGHRRRIQREIAHRLGHHANSPLFGLRAAVPETSRQHGGVDGIVHSERPKRRYKRRPRQDPHVPRRPDTGYVAYAKFLRQDPEVANLSFVDIAKLVGHRWSYLSSDIKGWWNDNAAVQRDEYKSATAQYHQTEAYRVHCNASETEQPRQDRREAQVNSNNAELERPLPEFKCDVSSTRYLAKCSEDTHPTELELAPGSWTTSYQGLAACMLAPTRASPPCNSSLRATSANGNAADQDLPVIEIILKMVSQDQASNPDILLAQISYDGLSSYTSQRSALSKSFHVQSINPFDFQPRAMVSKMIEDFLQSVNTVYYLVNPDDLWNHLKSVLDTTLETPNWIMSTVCICVALGCQTCPDSTANMAIMWYENGRRYLDDLDWCLDPTVMRILALISMFHMAQRPATSSHYLDAAIRIGEANRRSAALKRFEEAERCWESQWQDIYATIKTMHRILLLGCGTNESILPSLHTPLIERASSYGTTASQLTTATCAFSELSDILGSIQQQLGERTALPLLQGELFTQKLETWLKHLPDELSLPMRTKAHHVDLAMLEDVFCAASDVHKTERLHLYSLYFGVIGLLNSSSLRWIVTTNADRPTPAVDDNKKNAESAYECLNSALRLIDICTAFSSVSLFPVYAWLPQCVLFTSSLNCTLGIIWQRQLLDQDATTSVKWLEWSNRSLQNVLDIFGYCATHNEQSRRHYLVLQRIFGWLQSSAQL